MFKGKISVYNNVNGKEEKMRKEFKSEHNFNSFLKNNSMKDETKGLVFIEVEWPRHINDVSSFLLDADRKCEMKRVKEIERELDKIFKTK